MNDIDNPEVAEIVLFLDTEFVKMVQNISGSRNHRNGAVPGSRKRRNGQQILVRTTHLLLLLSQYPNHILIRVLSIS